MDVYEVIKKRRTTRDFSECVIEVETIKKIIEAGMMAPSNDHMRDWHFIILNDKQAIKKVIGKISKTQSSKRVDFILNSWKLTDECQRKMYKDGIPKQYQMLMNASWVLIPLFKQRTDLLKPKSLSSLNAFASIWCCIENIFLAATAENYSCSLRIPQNSEAEYIKKELCLPDKYVMPCYIGIGKPLDETLVVEQKSIDINDVIHFNQW